MPRTPRRPLRTVLAAALALLAAAGGAGAVGPQPGANWLTFERTADGVSLAGQVPGGTTRTVLGTYAAARFGAGRVSDSLATVDGELPADWVRMAMAALDTLAQIGSGTAELTPEAVMVRGTVGEPEEAGLLTRALREKLPPGVRISTEFTVPPPSPATLADISPERCAYLMTRIAEDRHIGFEPGSAEVEKDSLPGLGAIASLFNRCPEAEIEIGGYTDSRGDEDENLLLSQARAESVLEVLQAAGVRLRQLRARGFGEADPIADNDTEEGRARNRRIEFKAVE